MCFAWISRVFFFLSGRLIFWKDIRVELESSGEMAKFKSRNVSHPTASVSHVLFVMWKRNWFLGIHTSHLPTWTMQKAASVFSCQYMACVMCLIPIYRTFSLSEQINYTQEKERIFTLCFLAVRLLFQQNVLSSLC